MKSEFVVCLKKHGQNNVRCIQFYLLDMLSTNFTVENTVAITIKRNAATPKMT